MELSLSHPSSARNAAEGWGTHIGVITAMRTEGWGTRRQQELFAESAELPHFWQRRYYDFNVRTAKKRIEKLKYMHRNPVKRGLVKAPEDWRWSSYRSYAF